MTENHDAIVTDAKAEEGAVAAPSFTTGPCTRPRAVATASGGRSGSI